MEEQWNRNRQAKRDRERLLKLTEYIPMLKKFTMILCQIKKVGAKNKLTNKK